MPNMGFAAAILACLVTTCLMEAHAYPCSSKSDCAYKGCADRPCTSSSSYCNNGVWDYGCVSALEYFFDCLHAQLARMITCSCCTLYGLSLTAPRSDVGMCSSNCCYGYSMLSADKRAVHF